MVGAVVNYRKELCKVESENGAKWFMVNWFLLILDRLDIVESETLI